MFHPDEPEFIHEKNALLSKRSLTTNNLVQERVPEHVCLGACVCVSRCKLSIPGHGVCNFTGGLTLVNPLLGVLRMMM